MRPAWACILALSAAAASAGDVVERRGTAAQIEGEIVVTDDAGVTIRSSDLGAEHFVPWDRVRRVETGKSDPGLARHLERAVDLWRARSRVERGDTTLAEPLLERLFEHYRGATHETALVVAEGLLRCRIARADHVLAVVPALEVARLRRAGVATETYSGLAPVFDDEYALCTVLAPVWLDSPLIESVAHDLASYDARGDEVTAALAALYRAALLEALGRDVRLPASPPDHEGVALLAGLIECGSSVADTRDAARRRLLRRIDDMPPWAAAWTRFHVGVSLAGEEGIGRAQRGAVSLIYLPARFAAGQPYLAGLALARASEVLDGLGDAEAAAALRDELDRQYSGHPVHASVHPRPAAPAHEEDE